MKCEKNDSRKSTKKKNIGSDSFFSGNFFATHFFPAFFPCTFCPYVIFHGERKKLLVKKFHYWEKKCTGKNAKKCPGKMGSGKITGKIRGAPENNTVKIGALAVFSTYTQITNVFFH